ncbi:tyrosine-type recombinase/integrase [Nibribacter ruber]|uniref:Tyrosine-type recombinase/integrase n=1 Tax=Nibribacter ruber TaxID=2698458 RepID=A0A6P1NYI5_9BACT|nr:tyrosine-type recombinase/integrase [Nibribacter ruber]QHL87454.1 tyrosine-type recombinase/integrase [Nibribacter ruber]
MKTKRNIRSDRPDKRGYAPIRFTVHLDGARFYIETGEQCLPENWDGGMRLVTSGDHYHKQINARLIKWESILEEIATRYKSRRRILTQDLLLKEFYEAVDPEEEKQEVAFFQENAFLTLMHKWRSHQQSKIQLTTGKPLADSTIKGITSTIKRFEKFQEARGREITFEEMDLKFYEEFQQHLLIDKKQKVNNFGKHIDRLKTFLKWAEVQHDAPVNRKYKLFSSPEIYVGVDALSASELHAIYNLNFEDPQTKEKLFTCYKEKGVIKLEGSMRFGQWCKSVEKARDIFLMCCYTGMRISDALSFTMLDINHQQGLIIRPATKTLNDCYIPFFDDVLFKPKEMVMKYYLQYNTCMPPEPASKVNEYLKEIQKLVGIKRLTLTTKIGRKTFATLKLYQGIPSRIVMQATGHKTESSFNRYVGVNTSELGRAFKQGSAGVGMRDGVMMVG